MRFLGLAELPPKTNWGAIVAKHLFPKAAELSADAAAKLKDGAKLATFLGVSDAAGGTIKAGKFTFRGPPQQMARATNRDGDD